MSKETVNFNSVMCILIYWQYFYMESFEMFNNITDLGANFKSQQSQIWSQLTEN